MRRTIFITWLILQCTTQTWSQVFQINPVGGTVLAGTPVQLGSNFNDFLGIEIIGITNDRVLEEIFNIGFTFNFFNTPYSEFLIGANGFITFDKTISLEQRNFQPATIIPYSAINPNLPKACIFGPLKDWDHSSITNGGVTYRLMDVDGIKKLIITWCNIPVTGGSGSGIFQIILNEDNSIENHLFTLPLSTYNNNRATQGIVDISGFAAISINGRNNTNDWIPLSEPESRIYTPAAGSYDPIKLAQFTPFPVAESIAWYEVDDLLNKTATLGTTPNITVVPQRTTTYMAEVSTCWGEVFAWDTITVQVTNLVPTVFEPNSTISANTTFGLGSSASVIIGAFSLQVYNRWGEMVFETKDTGRRWNGRKHNTGQDCPMGVYTWILQADGSITNRGSVTLIR